MGAAIKFGFNINLGNWNPHICFCGLYGAESNVEVEYGVNWFCKPYIRGRAGGRALYPTEIFVGVENPDGNGNKISNTNNEEKKGFVSRHPIIVSVLISLIVGFILMFSFWKEIINWIEGLF